MVQGNLWSDKYVDEMLDKYDAYFGRYETITANPSYIQSKVSLDTLSEQFVAYLSTNVLTVAMQFKKERTMTTKEMIEVMQAYEDGKPIQFKSCADSQDEWSTITDPHWDWTTFTYRIAPEPSYRPYKDAAEFLDHLAKECKTTMDPVIPGVWIKNVHTGKVSLVIGYDTDNIYIDGDTFQFKSAFLHFTYTTGAPFGIKE